MFELELEWDLKSQLRGSEMKKKMSKHHKCMHICRDDWYFPWQVKKQMFATRKCSNSTLSEYGCLLKQHKAWRGGSLLIHKGRDKKQEASARFINLKEHQSSPYLSAENIHKYFTRVSRRSKLVTKLGYSASPKKKNLRQWAIPYFMLSTIKAIFSPKKEITFSGPPCLLCKKYKRKKGKWCIHVNLQVQKLQWRERTSLRISGGNPAASNVINGAGTFSPYIILKKQGSMS